MITWVVLTRGDRPAELAAAIASIRAQTVPARIVVVANGSESPVHVDGPDVEVLAVPDNLGVPGGRHEGVRLATTEVVAFLDDDAVLLTPDAGERIERCFDDPRCGAVSMRIEDEAGEVQRRHVPRWGRRGADVAGPAATFLGGASAVRRSAYDRVGGYWGDLFYAHEELDLSWRLHDAAFEVQYRPDIVVCHPRTPIGRHPRGWFLTGRNRVLVARRNLPAVLLVVHTATWLVLGVWRAPDRSCRRSYLVGWRSGWQAPVPRRPIRWSTVRRLGRAGRSPVV